MPSTADLAPEVIARNCQPSNTSNPEKIAAAYESFQLVTDSKVGNKGDHISLSRTESGSSVTDEVVPIDDLAKNPLVNSNYGADLDILIKMERANK